MKREKKKEKEEGLQERPTIWRMRFHHVGLPDVITTRVGVQCSVGGAGGATSIVSNGIKLNMIGSPSGTTFTYGEGIFANYLKMRVLGFELTAQISSKSTAPTTVVIIPSMESTNPLSTVANLEASSTQRMAVRRVVGAVGSGKDVIFARLPIRNMEQVSGAEGKIDASYDIDVSTGTPADPTLLAYLWVVATPTNGGSFTAATDPVVSIRGSLIVQHFQKQLP